MARPRCDPIDMPKALAALEQGVSITNVYREYASIASRPYNNNTFQQIVAREKRDTIPKKTTQPVATDYSTRFDAVKSNILTTTCDSASLRVKGGSLIVAHGDNTLVYSNRSEKPQSIVMTGWGGYVSIEAMRFCSDHSIAIVILDWTRDFMNVIAPSGKRAARLARSQIAADPLPIARAMVIAKIEAADAVGAITSHIVHRTLTQLREAASVDAVRLIEAQAARVSWEGMSIALRWRSPVRVPPNWKLPWTNRNSPRTLRSGGRARHARDPINAMLNLAYAIHVGRITVALVARGLNPCLGYLHSDREGRYSLSYDAIEPLRPHIEDAVFLFIEEHKFEVSDFVIENETHAVKFFERMINVFVEAVSLPQQMINQAADFLVRTILQTTRK
jgi:CRISP-associated protein Cas1